MKRLQTFYTRCLQALLPFVLTLSDGHSVGAITRCANRFDGKAVGADPCVRPECRGGCFRADTRVCPYRFRHGERRNNVHQILKKTTLWSLCLCVSSITPAGIYRYEQNDIKKNLCALCASVFNRFLRSRYIRPHRHRRPSFSRRQTEEEEWPSATKKQRKHRQKSGPKRHLMPCGPSQTACR